MFSSFYSFLFKISEKRMGCKTKFKKRKSEKKEILGNFHYEHFEQMNELQLMMKHLKRDLKTEKGII